MHEATLYSFLVRLCGLNAFSCFLLIILSFSSIHGTGVLPMPVRLVVSRRYGRHGRFDRGEENGFEFRRRKLFRRIVYDADSIFCTTRFRECYSTINPGIRELPCHNNGYQKYNISMRLAFTGGKLWK
jgi:hypothetical protein